MYSFTTSGGNVNITVNPASVSPNLNIALKITNVSGTTIVATVNPSTTLSATITATLAAGTYYLHVDGAGQDIPLTTGYSDYASIGQYSISVDFPISGGTLPPTVSITSPANGALYPTVPATVNITATASDPDGTITKVEFYNGSTLLGTSTASPYSFNWTGVTAGTYQLTAKAYDNLSAARSSSVVTIIAGNQLPTVLLTTPTNNSQFHITCKY